jgi:hypothetical protein
MEDLSVVRTGIDVVLRHTPRRGPGTPGDPARKQFAMNVIEVLESYGEHLTTGPTGTVASVLKFLLEAAGERATKDLSNLVDEGMKAAKDPEVGLPQRHEHGGCHRGIRRRVVRRLFSSRIERLFDN